MKNFRKNILTLGLAILIPQLSWGLATLRATYTGLVSKDALKDACVGTTCATNSPAMVPLYGLGADAIISLPLIPFGFGVRYENLGLSASSGSVEADAKLNRTALLINYRFIDTIIHFGLIGSFGLTHSGGMTVKVSNTNAVDYSGDNFTTYSLGAELEVKPLIVLPLVVGAEAGYMGANWKGAKDSVSSNTKDLDLSGTYAKLFIGLDF